MLAVNKTLKKRRVLPGDELAKAFTAYQQLLDSELIGITITDSQEKETILAANDYFLEMVGYSREEFEKGKVTWTTLTPQKWDDIDDELLSDMLETGVVRSVEKEYVHKDGHSVPVLAGAELIKDSEPLNISYAIQVRHQPGDEREREAFISTVRHELKTPLAIIKMQAELMRMDLLDGKVARALRGYIKEIEEQTYHIQSVLNDVLNMYQYANKDSSYRRRAMDVRQLVMEVVENTALVSGRQIQLNTPRQRCIARINKTRKRQVLINLINNAVKYSPANKPIIVNVKSDKEYVRISVKDYGRGIKKSDQKKIFKESYRVRTTEDWSQEASGIGLYLCDQIMRETGGWIEVESKIGKGSTFTCVVPKT